MKGVCEMQSISALLLNFCQKKQENCGGTLATNIVDGQLNIP
jgi:hypothetical protein